MKTSLFRALSVPLLLIAFAGAASAAGLERARTNAFFAFDNGVGRGTWTPEQQASILKQLGYDGIGYSGTENFDARLAAFRAAGLRIFNLYVPCYVDKPAAYDPQFPAAIQRLKGTGIALWLTVQGKATNDDVAARVVREIADIAAASGVRVALYPHKGFHIATAEDALRLLPKVDRPNVGLTINLCHELAAGNADKLTDIVKRSARHLYFVSINGADRTGGWNELIRPLGEGNFDVPGFLNTLDEVGYTGPIGLQCYNVKGDQKENLAKSMSAWKRMKTDANATK